jgi:dUTPase
VNAYARSHNKHSIELEAQTSHGYFGHLIPLNQQAKKGIRVLRGVIDPDYRGEIGLPLHNGSKKDYV